MFLEENGDAIVDRNYCAKKYLIKTVEKRQMNNRKSGIEGETLACEFLQENGYTIVDRNYLCKLGELDIVAKKGNVLAFVEVKARENTKFGMPFEAVNTAKIRNIIAVTKYYLMCHKNINMDIRFDVISILRGQIEHIQDAFRL